VELRDVYRRLVGIQTIRLLYLTWSDNIAGIGDPRDAEPMKGELWDKF
jgi:hypothetical protein